MKRKLNLGSGLDYRKNWDNVDIKEFVKGTIIMDLDNFPYLINDNIYDIVVIMSVLEHLKEPIKVLLEVIRICKNKARVIIWIPHARSYEHISDIQHKNNFTENTFKESLMVEYGLEKLHLLETNFTYCSKWKLYIPFKNYLKIFFNGIYDGIQFKFEVKK